MGLFALPIGKTWQENLENLTANVELLKEYPDADYLFRFMENCLNTAKDQYFKEKEIKYARRKEAH
jgi:hypothetical protein